MSDATNFTDVNSEIIKSQALYEQHLMALKAAKEKYHETNIALIRARSEKESLELQTEVYESRKKSWSEVAWNLRKEASIR